MVPFIRAIIRKIVDYTNGKETKSIITAPIRLPSVAKTEDSFFFFLIISLTMDFTYLMKHGRNKNV